MSPYPSRHSLFSCFIIQEILSDEIDDSEFLDFAIENLDGIFSYIINGNLNIRIHRDITGSKLLYP